MANVIKTKDGYVFMDVTERSTEVFSSNLFEMYAVWQSNGEVYRVPVHSVSEIIRAEDDGKRICILAGQLEVSVDIESWENADKIQHDGFMYVRFKDLKFCR